MPTAEFPPLTQEQFDKLQIICRAIVSRMRPQFQNLPACPDDLCSIAMYGGTESSIAGAVNGHRNWQPPRSYNVYVGQCAANALRDYRAKLLNQRRGDDAISPILHDYAADGVPLYCDISQILSAVPDSIPQRLNRERGAAQDARAYAAALAYREAYGLSWRRFMRKLREDPTLVKALGFMRPPAQSKIFNARRRLAEWYAKQPETAL